MSIFKKAPKKESSNVSVKIRKSVVEETLEAIRKMQEIEEQKKLKVA